MDNPLDHFIEERVLKEGRSSQLTCRERRGPPSPPASEGRGRGLPWLCCAASASSSSSSSFSSAINPGLDRVELCVLPKRGWAGGGEVRSAELQPEPDQEPSSALFGEPLAEIKKENILILFNQVFIELRMLSCDEKE
ncbi:uncharacterized protein ACIGJ3_022372 [Trichechus inunguis]